MKPKYSNYRGPVLFGAANHYGTPAVIGFTVFICGLNTDAGDLLRGGGTGRSAPPGAATGSGAATPAATAAARANAQDILARTTRTLDAMRAMQLAARNAALGGPNNLGAPAAPLPYVPNGLVTGGLQVAPGVTAGSSSWSGANLPVETHDNGLTQVTIQQTSQQALLNWQTFNVGRETTLTFDQSAGGANVSQWIAFNRIQDPSGNPTQILGSIRAAGQVYVINTNGIIFGGSSQVNTGGLTVSSLPLNTNLIDRGLLNNPDAQFLFSGLSIPAGINGTPAYASEAALTANGRYGDVIVQAGALLTSPSTAARVGGRITLVGPNVRNDGTISTPDGQTILAAGLQVGFDAHSTDDPSLRGLDVFVGAVGDVAGTVTQGGLIESPRGSITLAGRDIHQLGMLDSTTSVSLNGRIDIQAQYNAVSNRATASARGAMFLFQNTGTVDLGQDSVMRILPELASTETTIGTELALRSQVNIVGNTIHMGVDSQLLAPNARVDFAAGIWNFVGGVSPVATFSQSGGQIYLEQGAGIDVSGSVAVPVSVAQNIVTVQLRGAELAGSPLQRDGVLRNATVNVDIRDAGIYQQEMWLGTPLADVSGFANLIQRGVGQLTAAGGTVNISAGGSVVMQTGSSIDVSGGSIAYTGGAVRTTQLISNGHLVDISAALPNEVYDGIYDGTTVVVGEPMGNRVVNIYQNPLAPAGYRFEAGYTAGGAGGSLTLTAPAMALDGSLVGRTVTGGLQRTTQAPASSLTLNFLAQDARYPSLPYHAPDAPSIVFRPGVTQPAADAFTLDSNGNAPALRADRRETVYLSPGLLADGGFGALTIANNGGDITVPSGVDLTGRTGSSITLRAANITVDGSITAAGGNLALSTYSLSLDTINLLQNSAPAAAPPVAEAGRGLFTLGAGATLSTAGMLVDDRLESVTAGLSPIAMGGGSIRIEGYSVALAAGGLIDVSGGARAAANGAISYGNGGSLNIAAGREIGFSSTLGGTLQLGATLQGYSGARAGSLAVTAPAFQIGGTSGNANVTLLQPEFFSQGGFGGISLTGIGLVSQTVGEFVPGIDIVAGTRIAPVVQTYYASTSGGGDLGLEVVTRQEGVRPPVNLSFSAVGASYAGVPLVQGDVVMRAGASIEIDGSMTSDAVITSAGRGSVSFSGQTVTILGSVVAPGGSITVAGRNQFPADASIPALTALPTTHLGATAYLSTAGETVLVDNPFGWRRGQVIAGGTITVSGNIIAERGAVLDVSGTSGVLDLVPTFSSLDAQPAGQATVPVRIESNGGTINLSGSEMLFTDATLLGNAGGASATGGRLVVSSGRFIPNLSTYTTADVNLVVTQNGLALPAGGAAPGVGRLVLNADGTTVGQLGHFAVSSYASGGFDSLALNGNVRFDGPVSITAPGSLRIASGGVIQTHDDVTLSAGYVALGQAFRPPTQQSSVQLFTSGVAGTQEISNYYLSPTHGDGILTVHADLIDIGDLSLQGIGTANFLAPGGDVRGNGTVHIAGDMVFQAGQIYPTTQRAFNIFAYDYNAGGTNHAGSVTITGGELRPLPLAGGGTLSIEASEIHQGGTLRAPIGTINLGWDGTGTAPIDPIAGAPTAANPFQRPVTTQLTLASGSVTSTSAIDPVTGLGIRIPYGVSLDGNAWIDPAGNDITTSGAPSQAIHLSAGNLVSEIGSTLDTRGGGDLYAFRWISGNGGRNDVLASATSFAVIPGYDFAYVPYAPFNPDSSASLLEGQPGYVNNTLRAGDSVTLGAGAGLSAGTYTLLPARYALLPGAFLVTPQSGEPVGTVSRPDGSSLVSGYRSNNLDPARQGATLMSRYEIAGPQVVRARAQYQDLLANTVLRDAALAREFAVPRLPQDAGYLSFSSNGSIALAGQVESLALGSGRGGLIDINSTSHILINATGTGGGNGDLVLQASLLNSFGAESLLIGGLRSASQGGVAVSVTTDNLTLDNAGAALTGADIILVANQQLTLARDSSIIATGANTALDGITLGSSAHAGSGDGVLVRVSGNVTGTVSRLGVGTSATPELVVNAGTELHGGSIFLDSTHATRLDSAARVDGQAVSLSSGQISIQLTNPGLLNPTAGLVLSGDALASLQASANSLALLSYSSMDVYGTGSVGSSTLNQLSLQAASIRGFNNNGGTATFSAANIMIDNAGGGAAGTPLAGALQGTICFDANRLTLGNHSVRLDGFANAALDASSGIIVAGTGSFSAAGNVTLNTPLVTGASAASHEIIADGLLSLARPAAAGSLVAGGFGAELTLEGASVTVDSNIVLASGELTLHATSGDLRVGATSSALIDVGGTATHFVDVTRYTSGGIVNLVADSGSVNIAGGGVVSVSANSGGGNAGRLNVRTPGGVFNLTGAINATAGTAGRGGEFALDSASLTGGSLASLDAILNAGQFSQSRYYRIRSGDVLVAGTAQAHDYQVAADHGSITVTGTIDASGSAGGNIELQASGSLILDAGSLLTVAGEDFNSAGKGGSITLEAGAQCNGVIDRSALLDIRSGSTLDLSVAANDADSAATGQFTGRLHLRAPRTVANNDVQIAPVAGTITGASSILVEGNALYALTGTGVVTTAVQNSIRNDATAFLGAAGTTTAGYSAMLARLTSARPGLDLILAPGAEIINLTGDLTLGTTTTTSTSDWNLQTFRFGPTGAPGVLTMRAAGNLVFYNTLSDGFAAVTPSSTNGQSSLWLAPLMAQNPLLPVNTQSWSYRLTSGADMSSADFGAVRDESVLQPGTGSLLLGRNYGNAATYGSGANFLTATAIANRYQVIRTGSGDITINAAGNAYLLNQFATIYTAGTQVLDATHLYAAGDFVVPMMVSATGRQPTAGSILGAYQQNYYVQYSMAGGDVSIMAGGDIAHMTRTVSSGTGGVLIEDSSRQIPVSWLYRRGYVDPVTGEFGVGGANDGGASLTDPAASTSWWVDYSNFFEGVGALGGGNVTLVAGNDVRNIDAVAPTNARMASGRPDAARMVELGGGDVTVLAGGDINGGVYYVERGQGRLMAGGSITTNATRSPSRGILASLTNPVIYDSNTWLPTTLFLGKGGFDLQAGGDLLLGPVANPFLLPQGNGNKFWYKTYFSTYAADSYVNAISLGGDVTHRTEVSLPGETIARPALSAWMFANNTLSTAQGAAGYQPWLRMAETTVTPFATLFGLMAPSLRSTALSGDINLAGNLTLSPAASGQIELLAQGSISGLQASGFITNLGVERWITSTVNLSDADPAAIPGITTPYAYQQVVGRAVSGLRETNTGAGEGFLNFLDAKFIETGSTAGVLEDEQARHALGLLHLADRTPLRVFALDGDIEGLTIFSPKMARVFAGRDIGDIAFYFQNLNASDVSVVSAGRDLVLYNANTVTRAYANASIASNISVKLEPLAGDIQISGPGNLEVLAGRDLDLGLGGGNVDGTGVGVTSIGNGRNPYLQFEGAGVTVAAGIGPASSLANSNLLFSAFIHDFVATADGAAYLTEIAPGVDFAAQSEEEQARLALEVFYLVLRDTGRDYNNPDSAGFRNYDAGLAAIKSLFGTGPWEGGILTQGRDIRTRNGGDISIIVPGGGLTMASTTLGNPLTPPGIVTEAGGNISIFTDQSVNIGIGRIFTLRGGNAIIWSSRGDIAAGSSSRTIAAAPPTRVLIDPQSATVETDLAGLATGGGIGVLATVEGVKPGDVDLIAPTGRIDAGDAGIRVSGNINLAGLTIVNAGNISAGGTSTGAPSASVSAPSISAVTTASNTSAAAGATAANPAAGPASTDPKTVADALSIITVEVIGYGGSSDEDEEEKKDVEVL